MINRSKSKVKKFVFKSHNKFKAFDFKQPVIKSNVVEVYILPKQTGKKIGE